MPNPTPPVVNIPQSDVGTVYHLALGYTDPLDTNLKTYGFMLTPQQPFNENTDLHAKDTLTQYASPNIIDRDLVNMPRVSVGDFSGGMGQINFIDPKRFFDTSLDIGFAGYLRLQHKRQRSTVTTGALASNAGNFPQCSTGNSQTYPYLEKGVGSGNPQHSLYYTYGETSGKVYDAAPNPTYTIAFSHAAVFIDTDNQYLYASDGVNKLSRWNPENNAYTALSTTLGAHNNIWAIDHGSGGIYIYYTTTKAPGTGAGGWPVNQLWRYDLLANTTAQLAFGASSRFIQDVCQYLDGVAVLSYTKDGWEVWYHDGTNSSRLLQVRQQYSIQDGGATGGGTGPLGICNVLGVLYVPASPQLWSITGSSAEIVVDARLPSSTTYSSYQDYLLGSWGAPMSIGSSIYWGGANAVSIAGNNPPNSCNNFLWRFDTLTGALSHDQGTTSNDMVPWWPRGLMGTTVATLQDIYGPYITGGTSYLGRLQTSNQYATTGYLVTSRMDFGTPGINKMFRRVRCYHAPLVAGDSIQLNAYLDKDPTFWDNGTTTPTVSVTNSTAGASVTVLTFAADTIATSCFLWVQMTRNSTVTHTPVIYYMTTEVAVPWTWEFTVDLMNKRRCLNGQEDPTGLRGFDLYSFLHNAWEFGQLLTLYHPNGQSYAAAIESIKFSMLSPRLGTVDPLRSSDLEGTATLLLRNDTL